MSNFLDRFKQYDATQAIESHLRDPELKKYSRDVYRLLDNITQEVKVIELVKYQRVKRKLTHIIHYYYKNRLDNNHYNWCKTSLKSHISCVIFALLREPLKKQQNKIVCEIKSRD